tara:strand:- start:2181 stop:3485 length:1305 start_codon:yes stop_codon:yes gene_type:complete
MIFDLMNKLRVPLNKLNFKNLITFYFIFLILVICATIFYSYLFINKFPNNFDQQFNLIIENIEFGNGPLIYNLLNYGEYQSKFSGIDFHLQKLPVLPLFYTFILKISENFFYFITLKNTITFSLIYIVCFFSLKSLNKNLLDFFILIGFIFIIPYNLFVFLNYQYADCLLAVLLPSLYLILISNLKLKFYFASIILFLLYLTKTSMVYLVLIIPVVVILKEKKGLNKYAITLGPIFAILLWGSFGYKMLNKFTFGSDMLSVNPMGIHIVTHTDFYNYFPYKSVDLLQAKIKLPDYIKTETEFFNYYKDKNEKFFSINENRNKFILDSFKKIKFILFNIKRDSAFMKNGKFDNSIRYSLIPDKIILNLSIFFSILFFLKNCRKTICNYEIYYIFIVSLNMLPHVAAWATSKHLIPIFVISFFYLYLRVFSFYAKK